MIESIVIIGSGNVGWHLTESLTLAGYEVTQVYGRNKKDQHFFDHLNIREYITNISQIDQHAGLYLICVNDDAILSVAESLPFKPDDDQIIVHTSGTVPASILKQITNNHGCIWPLQTLKRESPVATNELPLVITASNEYVQSSLIELADQLSDHFTVMNDDKKEKLHLAAVMVNNFSNHLYTLTQDYCKNEQLDFHLLLSLIKETAEKLNFDSPENNQTGPAIRNDKKTIERHLEKLEKHPDLYKLYCIFSENIIKKYHA